MQIVHAIAAMAQVDHGERDLYSNSASLGVRADGDTDAGGTVQPSVLIGACGVKRCVGRHVCFLPLTRVNMAKIGQPIEGGLSADGGQSADTGADFEVSGNSLIHFIFTFILFLYFYSVVSLS